MHTIELEYQGELRNKATHLPSGSVIESDAPIDNQGKGECFSPTDLMASSLGLCMMTILGIKARDKGIDLRGTKIRIEKMMTNNPRRIGSINIVFIFLPSLPDLSQKDKMILEKAAHSCPVLSSMHPEIKVNICFYW